MHFYLDKDFNIYFFIQIKLFQIKRPVKPTYFMYLFIFVELSNSQKQIILRKNHG